MPVWIKWKCWDAAGARNLRPAIQTEQATEFKFILSSSSPHSKSSTVVDTQIRAHTPHIAAEEQDKDREREAERKGGGERGRDLFLSNIWIWLLVWLKFLLACMHACVHWLCAPWVHAGGWQNPHLKPESLFAHQHGYETRHSKSFFKEALSFSGSLLGLILSSIHFEDFL